jgi:hypothetical protein
MSELGMRKTRRCLRTIMMSAHWVIEMSKLTLARKRRARGNVCLGRITGPGEPNMESISIKVTNTNCFWCGMLESGTYQ